MGYVYLLSTAEFLEHWCLICSSTVIFARYLVLITATNEAQLCKGMTRGTL